MSVGRDKLAKLIGSLNISAYRLNSQAHILIRRRNESTLQGVG